jgi:hypothetical protein
LAKARLESKGHKVTFNEAKSLAGRRDGDLLVHMKTVWPTEVKTHLSAPDTGNLCFEHQSQRTHTAPLYLHVIPIVIGISAANQQHIIDSWPDRRPGGDDGRMQTIFPLPFDIIWKKDDPYASNFKRI